MRSSLAVLLPHGAFLTEDRLTFTHETAEPLGVSPPEAVDSFLIEKLVMRDSRARLRRAPDQPQCWGLSAREREVLQLLAEGKSTKEIAGMLGVSVKTVEANSHHVREKLDLHSIAELTKWAVREGLTSLDH